jgi:hypothetical protein
MATHFIWPALRDLFLFSDARYCLFTNVCRPNLWSKSTVWNCCRLRSPYITSFRERMFVGFLRQQRSTINFSNHGGTEVPTYVKLDIFVCNTAVPGSIHLSCKPPPPSFAERAITTATQCQSSEYYREYIALAAHNNLLAFRHWNLISLKLHA